MPTATADKPSATTTTGTTETRSTTAEAAVTKAMASTQPDSSSGTSQPSAGAASASGSGASTIAAPAAGTTSTITPESFKALQDKHDELTRRFESVARNTRDATLSEWRDKFGWAEKTDRAKIDRAIQILDRLDGNPRAFLNDLGKELQAGVTADPDPDLVTADGKHKAYSADAMRVIVGNAVSKAINDFKAEIDPALKFTAEAKQRQTRDQFISEGQKAIMEAWNGLQAVTPWLKDATPEKMAAHQKGIAEQLAKIPDEQKSRHGAAWALDRAVQAYYYSSVLPSERATAKDDVLTDLQKKAAASTGTVGGTGTVTGTKRPQTEAELSRHIAETLLPAAMR